jgi:hypothetical protein
MRFPERVLIALAIFFVGCNAMPPGGTRPPSETTAPSVFATPAEAPPSTSPPPPPSATGVPMSSIPLCDDVPYLYASDDFYRRDRSVSADASEQMVATVRDWARQKPGFEDLWIDRSEHNGWLTLAFSRDAAERQVELESRFPDFAVVAVGVDWTLTDLQEVQNRVIDAFRGSATNFGSGIFVNKGVVSIELGIRRPELVAHAEQMFAGEAVCLSGLDPALAPAEGPQLPAGAGWRLLADEDQSGQSYRTGIGYDEASYDAVWAAAGLTSYRPAVDFTTDVVIWFGAVHGSSCPRMRLDDVVTDRDRSLVFSDITYLDVGICTADAVPHAYVVAYARSSLPVGAFTIQLQSADPPPGVIDRERTLVKVDLSTPGSTARPADVHPRPGDRH